MNTSWFLPVTHVIHRAVFILCFTVTFTASQVDLSYANPRSLTQTATQLTSKTPSVHEEWSGMYMSGQKVGYAQLKLESTVFAGKPALRETSHSVFHILLLGQTMQEEENSVTVTDLKSQPLTQTINVSSNGSAMHLVAEYDYTARKIYCTVGTGGGASKKTLDIPAGANLAGDVQFATAGRMLVVGEKFDIYTLEPTTIVLEPVHVEVTGRQEILDEAGVKVPVFVTKESLSVGESTVWINSSGVAIKGELLVGPLQIVITAESKQHALNTGFVSPTVSAAGVPDYSPPTDLAVATAVGIDKAILDPRKLQTLHAVMSGLPTDRLVISDSRQKETIIGSDKPPLSVDLLVHAVAPDTSKTIKLPVTDAAFSNYLHKAAYLNTDDPALRKLALQLRGNETDTFKIALAIRDWAHQNMTPDASIGVPRSAEDVLLRRRGVCRDYATLYTALARIAGVPTRMCAGVVYADLDGRPAFYYHAWAESYVGQWVAIDPTLYDPSLGIDYVDATHIKFAQGDVTEMYDAVSVVGKLKITIK